MARVMPMPEVAAASGSAELQSWLVGAGETFTAGQAIAVIETEKAVVDLEADADGVLLELLAVPGATVEVGDPIAILGAPGETAEAAAELLATLRPPDQTADHVAILPAAASDSPVNAAGDRANGHPVPGATGLGQRIFTSPLARRMARDAGIPIEHIVGTGPGGRIVRRDVETAITRRRADAEPSSTVTTPVPPAAAPAPPAPPVRAAPAAALPLPGAGFTDQPHSRMRRAIATRLSRSKQTIPHFYLRGTCRVDALLALRVQLNELGLVKISVNDLVVKAAARAHRAVPEMNVIWTDDAVRRYETVDLAVAVATGGGLVTPVLRGADRLSISELATTTRELAGRAKSGQLKQAELEGGTMTVTNLGMFGTQEFGGIINPPQAAILAVGAAIAAPIVVDGALEVGTVMNVTLSVDHRPVDGVVAAQWMQAFVSLIERPLHLLA